MHLKIVWVDWVVVGNEEVKNFPLATSTLCHLGERRGGWGVSQPPLSSFGDIRSLPGEVTGVVLWRKWGDLEASGGVSKSKLDVEDGRGSNIGGVDDDIGSPSSGGDFDDGKGSVTSRGGTWIVLGQCYREQDGQKHRDQHVG